MTATSASLLAALIVSMIANLALTSRRGRRREERRTGRMSGDGDYISRKEAEKVLSQPVTMSMCLTTEECKMKNAQRQIDLLVIRGLPAADVRPVVHGVLVKNGWSIRCSICGYDMPFTTRNFCPNCGADMRGEQDV